MFKKLLIIIILIINQPIVQASFWGALGACFIDPCNCGDTDADRKEYHEDELLREVKRDSLCPPWNKEDGRDDDTCLVLQDYPASFILEYENICGEEAMDSTYFTPKIRVRGQQCNGAACWTTENILNWGGECINLNSGYGFFPRHRMCARMAFPRDEIRDSEQDPGYTNGEHLDWKGATVPDGEIIGVDGQPIDVEVPKLCLYKDPSLYSLDGLIIDVMDTDDSYQPMHQMDGVHPIVDVILFFFSVITDTGVSLVDMLDSLFASLLGAEEGKTTLGAVLGNVFGFIGELIGLIGDVIRPFLEEIAQINRSVDDQEYGCVNVPLGPYPPPFCESIVPYLIAETHEICAFGNDGQPVQSTSRRPCQVSTLENSYLRNSIRIGYPDLIPLCQADENPDETDSCVLIEQLGLFASAQALHVMTNQFDIIKHCDDSDSGAPCVRSMVPHSCSVSNHGCQDGFRIVYGKRVGPAFTPQTYYRDDLPDCIDGSGAVCQEIWGINRGEFVDVSLLFPTSQTSSDISPIVENTSLSNSGKEEQFTASIVRVAAYDETYGFRQEPGQICVFKDEFVIGCKKRAPVPRPVVYACDASPDSSITCSSDHFSPKFIVSYNAGGDRITSVIEPKSVHNRGSFDNVINLAGDNFEAFVTDDSFKVKPFSGPNSPNTSSIYGTYQDGIPPINGEEIDEYAVHLEGIEYITDEYHLGGKHACLRSLSGVKCPEDPAMCVLTSLLNSNIVRCSLFLDKSVAHQNMQLCSSEEISQCTIVDSMPTQDGGTIAIRACPGNKNCYDSDVELCAVSYHHQDRLIPAASAGAKLSDDQYYDTLVTGTNNVVLGHNANYHRDTEIVRNKTPRELGLCVPVPGGTCPAIEVPTIDSGFATWPAATLGEDVIGVCPPGMEPKTIQSDLVRKCIANPATEDFNLEPVYRLVRDPDTGALQKEYLTNIQCIPSTP